MGIRIQNTETDTITARFVDDALAGVTGLSPTVTIRRAGVSPAEFWDTDGTYNTTPIAHPMAEDDVTDSPGQYSFDFDATAGSGANLEEHVWLASANDAGVHNPEQMGSIYVDNLLTKVGEALVGRVEVDITVTPWTENHYDLATRTSIVRSFELFDQDGVALSGDDSSGNNPLNDSTRLIARRPLV